MSKPQCPIHNTSLILIQDGVFSYLLCQKCEQDKEVRETDKSICSHETVCQNILDLNFYKLRVSLYTKIIHAQCFDLMELEKNLRQQFARDIRERYKQSTSELLANRIATWLEKK